MGSCRILFVSWTRVTTAGALAASARRGSGIIEDMRLRMELFVDDVDTSVAFYSEMLGFEVVRRTGDYASLRCGRVVLGFWPVAQLPERGAGPGFTQARLGIDKGGGVEIVFEVDGVEELAGLHQRCQAKGVVVQALVLRPWGLQDFRLVDPDGYYVRVTHGDAAGTSTVDQFESAAPEPRDLSAYPESGMLVCGCGAKIVPGKPTEMSDIVARHHCQVTGVPSPVAEVVRHVTTMLTVAIVLAAILAAIAIMRGAWS